MNMLNRNCKTSFVKPEFLKKSQRANPRLHDIGCYNDNLALMLAPESDEMIRLTQESRSKLNLKAQLQDKDIAICELKKLIEKMKGKYVETKFEKPLVIRQPNTFKSQRQSVLGKLPTFLDSLAKTDFSKSKSVTTNNVSNNFSNPVTTQILPQNVKSILKNINVIAPGMYEVHTKSNQTRTPQLPQDIRKTNKRVSFSTRVIPTTSVSRPQVKSNQLEDRVMHNNSQGKNLNAKTSTVNFVNVTCGKCVLNGNHDMCVLHYVNRVNARTKQLIVVPISTRKSIRTVNQSVVTPLKKTVTSESTHQKPRIKIRKQYEHASKTCRWWYSKITPPGYKWEPKSISGNVNTNLIEIILFIIDSGCSKRMMKNLKLLSNFMEKFLGTVKFRNDHIASILGYGDLFQGNGNDLLTGSRGSDLYSITLQHTFTPNPIYLMAKASSSQAWLWHRRILHLNFDTINLLLKYDIVTGLPKLKFVKDHLCSSCELGKEKRYSTQSTAYRVYNKRTRVIVEMIHVNFDELPHMVSDHVSSDPIPQCPTMALEQLDLLFSLMFDELLNGTTPVVSKSSTVSAADIRDQRQQYNTTTSTSTTVAADLPLLNI
ncbi:retrovirus-related pol polyprotein from transposon TNT 1-94 [Tanacetum coccineum]